MEQTVGFVATSQGKVAFASVGSGPPLLCDTGWVGHLTFAWQSGPFRRFFEKLAERRTVILYDKPGSGLSDRSRTDFSAEPEVEALEAIVARLELNRLSLLGMSQGGPVAALYASRHPDTVDRLVLYGTYARGQNLGRPESQRALVGLVRASWGLASDALAGLFVAGTDAATRDWFTRAQRASADAENAARLLEMNYVTDVSAEMQSIQAPTLVLHREGDRAIRFACGREAAGLIPNATFVSLQGQAHIAYVGDSEAVLKAILGFLGDGGRSAGPLTGRELEVAGLVAEGLTNGAIATRLKVAPRTVDAHLEHIRNKLGFHSRTQIGVWATERKRRL